jgi:hypothetical protein
MLCVQPYQQSPPETPPLLLDWRIAGVFMTVTPPIPDAERARRPRRFVTAAIAVAVLLAILLGVGLVKSMNARRMLCPPSNPNCGLLPPSPPPVAPPATPPR